MAELWQSPDGPVSLAPGEIHVWRVSLLQSEAYINKLWGLLEPREQNRANRFHFEKDRTRYVIGRGVLRVLLERYTGIAPEAIRLAYAERGKPYLQGAGQAPNLQFNAADSHELSLCAFAWDRRIGVDLEYIRPIADLLGLAETAFSPAEREALRTVDEPLRLPAFYAAWTRKEAYLKAIGEGLYHPLDAFDVSLAPDAPAALLRIDGDPEKAAGWSAWNINAAPAYAAALIAEGQGWRVTYWQFSASE